MEALGGLPFIIIMVAIFWLLLIRPQRKRQQQHQELVQSLSAADRVVTIGGVHGTVQSLDDETVRLEVAPGTVVTFARQAISRRLVDAGTGADDPFES